MGAKLILSARNKAKLEEVKGKLAHPNDARVLPVDLSDPEATRAIADRAKNLFGRIDILVNNAGVSIRALFVDIQEHVHRKVMEVDFFAPWILTHKLIKDMMRQEFGHVVNVSSVAGKYGLYERTAYCSAKFALNGLMDSVRYEMQGSSVHVTNILPGPVLTNVSKSALKADGSLYGLTDQRLATNGMVVQRCAELCLIGVSNQLKEVWISPQPVLMHPYLSHYCPSLLHYLMSRRASAEQLKAVNNAKMK